MINSVSGETIAQFLGKELIGENKQIIKPSDYLNSSEGSIVWCRSNRRETIQIINLSHPSLVICDSSAAEKISVPYIISENPKLDYCRVLQTFFNVIASPEIHKTAIFSKNTIIGEGVTIGPYSCIGPEVTIGNNCIIGPGVVIEGEVIIGNNCRIKPNVAIGGQGFSFVAEETGRQIHFPHVGRIIIGDEVWLGASSTIERGTLGDTTIESGVKVDDLVQIGHNSYVSQNALITAGCIIGGGVLVGPSTQIGPRSVIKEGVTIGPHCLVGSGSVVVKDISAYSVVAGVPARCLRSNR